MDLLQSQQKRGGLVSMSPSHTPRASDKSSRDLRSADSNSNNKHDKEKGVNVQVILRCRPLSDDELRTHTPVVISCNEGRKEVSAAQIIASKQIDRTFLFDKVFGPSSKQKTLYDAVVSPIVHEVLEGYNCTIFAYGQTGTGKTYTMEGGGRKKNGEFPSDAGMIPRAVRQIFDILESQNAEYSMKVTFQELYNEEISDLLAMDEASKFTDEKLKKPIALMEDGKGGVFVRGLEEEIVCTANEIYKILEKGSAKRRTAETLLNKQSSRSHSIFSITIHIKECTPEGEEMIKCGKLNLVDLAGSENISRSGAREGRAREAGEINKSLLTLGRVINALVEHSGHIPYRDSKLTRLLRDSLGGKTKTCIIATISPSIHCLEETLSTLDYAHRAKNIKNKPEINQKMMKSAMIKDLYSEIERLKQEVYAAREKNGIYLPRDRYIQEEAEKKAMIEKIERLELESDCKDKHFMELQELYNSQLHVTADLSRKLEKTEKKLGETEYALFDIEEKQRQTSATLNDREILISNLLKSEKALVNRAFELRAELENAATDVGALFCKIERKDKMEDGNKTLVQKFQAQLFQQLELLHRTMAASVTQQEQQLKTMEDDVKSFVSAKADAAEKLRERVHVVKKMYGSGVKALDDLAMQLEGNACSTFSHLNSVLYNYSQALETLLQGITLEADELLNDIQSSLLLQEEKLTVYAQNQCAAHHRAVETERSVSEIAVNFFMMLDMHAANLNRIVEGAQNENDQKLSQLEEKFEACIANEEGQLLEKVAEMLRNSNARKKELVQMAVHELQEGTSSRTSKLQQEVSSIQGCTTCMKTQWKTHVERAESNHVEGISVVDNGKKDLVENLHNCLKKAQTGAQHCQTARQSLLAANKSNAASVESTIRDGVEANLSLRARLSSAASDLQENTNTATNDLLSSIDDSLRFDRDASQNLTSMIAPCGQDLRELKSNHYHHTVDITKQAEKSLINDYLVDEPSCLTPRKRSFNLPTIGSIEELATPAFEELLRSFSDSKFSKQPNGDIKHMVATYESTAQSLRDPTRLPLAAIN